MNIAALHTTQAEITLDCASNQVAKQSRLETNTIAVVL